MSFLLSVCFYAYIVWVMKCLFFNTPTLKNKELNKDILNLYNDIKNEMAKLSLLNVIDYSIRLTTNNEEKSVITISFFNSYSMSKIGRQISLVNTNNWKIKCNVIKTHNSAIYEEDYFTFNNINHNHLISVLIFKGLKTPTIISNGFEKGKTFSTKFKG